MNFLLASGNNHKAEEFKTLFPDEFISIEAAPLKIEVEETGATYFENAALKAKAYYDRFGKPVMADDSGLNVESLPGELGIYSARFGGEGLNQEQRNELLLKKLDGISDRRASFSCVLCFYLKPEEIYFFEGILKGKISHSPMGLNGFGYDPLFIPDDHPNT